jgi:mannose/fructose-specific phosphotransferase system component IIA
MANSVKSMVAYNAALQALQIQDKMLSDLVDIVGGAPNNVFATH